ncbi:hypothetical protein FF1_004311 [Malus domestica]
MLLANKKLVDVAAKILLEMKAMGYSVDVSASDVLMVYIKEGSVDVALRWLRFMGSSGIRTNNFIIRQLFESCMKSGIDYELEEGPAKYFVNVLLNYLVLMGQINRAWCVWKVAYENNLFPKAIVFDQQIAWSLDVRNLSVGAALIAVAHTLHRFRKRMLYYGVIPRRFKLVTGPTLKIVVAQILNSVESPFEVSKVVLRAPGDAVMEWYKKPIVQQFLLNEIPSRSDILTHKLNTLFPSSAPELRSLAPPKMLMPRKVM